MRTDIQKKQDAEINKRLSASTTKGDQARSQYGADGGYGDSNVGDEQQNKALATRTRTRMDADDFKSMLNPRKFSDRQQADMSKLLGNIAGTEGRAKGTVRRLSADQKRERDMAKLEAGRKAYIDPKTGKASPEGVKRYISKARQMRSGSNVPVDQKTTDVIATSAGQDYAKKIEDKYGGTRARKRGINQPSLADVQSKIDAENPTVRALMPAGSGKPIPDKTRKTVDKDLGNDLYGSFKDFLNRSKGDKQKRDEINRGIENNPEDLQTKRIEREAERNQGARSAVEKQSGTKIRDFGLDKGTVTPGNERQSQPFKSFIDDTERLQQTSRAGALAGLVTKSLVQHPLVLKPLKDINLVIQEVLRYQQCKLWIYLFYQKLLVLLMH